MSENCLVCGEQIEYFNTPKDVSCYYCGKKDSETVMCKNGHYVCNDCHRKDGLKAIEQYCINSDSQDPIEIADELFKIPFIHMHGPEHHSLVPAVIVTAYNNAIGEKDDKMIKEAIRRGSKVNGGFCGTHGACGAGVGAGIAYSIISETTPLSSKTWGQSNYATSKALSEIAKYGGPRCCKRCTITSIKSAVEYIEETLNVKLELTEYNCSHNERNRECIRVKCDYYNR